MGGSFANHKFSLNFVLCTWIYISVYLDSARALDMARDVALQDGGRSIELENWIGKYIWQKYVWQLKRKVCLAIGLVVHHRGGAVFSKRENTAEHGNNEFNTDHFDFIRIIIVILNRDYHCHLKNQAAKPSAEFFAPVWIFHGNLLLDCKDASSLPTPIPH